MFLRLDFGRQFKKHFFDFVFRYTMRSDVKSAEVRVALDPNQLSVRHLQVWSQRAVQVLVQKVIKIGFVHAPVYTIVYTPRQLFASSSARMLQSLGRHRYYAHAPRAKRTRG